MQNKGFSRKREREREKRPITADILLRVKQVWQRQADWNAEML